jgi:hypothetical protein
MKKVFKIFLWLPFASLLFAGGCYYDNLEELHPELVLNNQTCDTTVTISFKNDIQPILLSNCGSNNSCHQIGGTSGIWELQDYAGVQNVAANGLLISSITWDGNNEAMPKGSASKISDCNIGKIQKWINENYPDN